MDNNNALTHFRDPYSGPLGITSILCGMWRKMRPGEDIESVLELLMVRAIHENRKWFNAEFYLQVEEGPYRIDLVITDGTNKVAVECDGHDWHEKNQQQAVNDRKRDRYLQRKGYFVARFTGYEIYKNVDMVIKELIQICRYKGLAKSID
jgi:very-short-patch-repair endonuclease